MIDSIPADITRPEWPPVMPWREFAEWIRVDSGIVLGWVEKGHLPTTKIGRHRMVNVAALVDQLREAEQ